MDKRESKPVPIRIEPALRPGMIRFDPISVVPREESPGVVKGLQA